MKGRNGNGRRGRHPNQTPPELTRAHQRAFLEALASSGNHVKACEEARIGSARTPYVWAERSEAFAQKLAEARAMGEKVALAQYEAILDTRISATTKDPYSGILTMFRVKRLDPRYRDNVSVNVVATGPVAINMGLDGAGEATTSGGEAHGQKAIEA